MTTTLSAEDVWRLVMAPVAFGKPGERADAVVVPALFTRCPGCEPEGLEWMNPVWRLRDHCLIMEDRGKLPRVMPVVAVNPRDAIDLILQAIARDGTAVFKKDAPEHYRPYRDLAVAVMTGNLSDAVASRHWLADLENKT